jgi:cardiolipin synthase
VLAGHTRVGLSQPRRQLGRSGGGRAGRAAAGALRIGNTVSAVLTNRRILGPAEAGLMTGMGLGLLGLSAVAVLWPPIIMLPLALLGVWLAVSILIKAMHLRAQAREPHEHGQWSVESEPAEPEKARPEDRGVPFS